MERLIARRKAIILALVAMVITFGVVAMGCACGTTEAPKVGAHAPDFTLPVLDGQSISLSDLRGRAVVLNFWATWCGPCVAEMPHLQEVFEERAGDDLSMFLINIAQGSGTVRQFVQANGLSIPVLLDSRGDVATRYDIRAIPATFFIDKEGNIQAIKVGSFSNKAEIEAYLESII